jgi:hypothetical protein
MFIRSSYPRLWLSLHFPSLSWYERMKHYAEQREFERRRQRDWEDAGCPDGLHPETLAENARQQSIDRDEIASMTWRQLLKFANSFYSKPFLGTEARQSTDGSTAEVA